MTHTPGPWKVVAPFGVANPRDLHVMGPTVASGVVAKVNAKRPMDARLIAAAPALLEALIAIERRLGAHPDDSLEDDRRDKHKAHAIARAAITLTRGTAS